MPPCYDDVACSKLQYRSSCGKRALGIQNIDPAQGLGLEYVRGDHVGEGKKLLREGFLRPPIQQAASGLRLDHRIEHQG